eukprot:gene17742-9412_t
MLKLRYAACSCPKILLEGITSNNSKVRSGIQFKSFDSLRYPATKSNVRLMTAVPESRQEPTATRIVDNTIAMLDKLEKKARKDEATLNSQATRFKVEENVTPVIENKFSLPQHHPSKLDRFTLIATRTLKAEDIGSEVSLDVMAKANTRRRISVNVFLMVFTLFGSIWAVWQGKKEMKINNIYEINKRR